MPREGGPIARMLYEHQITKNLAESAGNKAIMLATMDADKHPSAVMPYRSKGIEDFFGNIWWLAADVMTRGRTKPISNTKLFDPQVFQQIERYDERINAVVHSYRVNENTYAFNNKKTFLIPEGTTIEIGISQKENLEDVVPTLERAGWRNFDPGFEYDSTIRAYLGAANGTPQRWIPMLG